MQAVLQSLLSAAAAGSSEDCAGADCVVSTFDSACCSDGFACLAQLPSPKCHANPFPVVPPGLNNPRLIVNSTSVAATASSAGISTARILPKRGAHKAFLMPHMGQVCGTAKHAVPLFCFHHQDRHVCHAGPFKPLAIADTEAVAFPTLPAFLGGGGASSGPLPSALEEAVSASETAALPAVSGSDSFHFNVSEGLPE